VAVGARHQQQLGTAGSRTDTGPGGAGVRSGASGVDRGPDLGVGKIKGYDHAGQHDLVVERQDRQPYGFAHHLHPQVRLTCRKLSYLDSMRGGPLRIPRSL
jgi:hypothetical protein